MIKKHIKNYLITGDTHGAVPTRLAAIGPTDYKPEETALIILGDAGFNFYLNKTDRNLKRNVQNSGFTVYCVRGNHEERAENLEYIIHEWDENVGEYIIYEPDYPNIRYLNDGLVYRINDKSVLVIGGAYSVDKWYRLDRAPAGAKWTGWFESEQLTKEEMLEIELAHAYKSVDFVFTHTCPESWEPRDLFLNGLDQSTVDKSMEKWMDKFKNVLNWKVWLFGHYHDDRLVRPGVEMYYKDIEDIETIWERWQNPDNLDWWLKKDPNYDKGV